MHISELDPQTIKAIDKSLEQRSNVGAILESIQKAELIREHKRKVQQYVNLAITEQIVNSISFWFEKNTESEATFYRRLASILNMYIVGRHRCEVLTSD